MPEDQISWAAIAGEWEFEGSKAVYRPSKDLPRQYGIALTNKKLWRGSVRCDVDFQCGADAAARIVVGYDTETRSYYSLGLGGWNAAYVIDLFSDQRWNLLYGAGSQTNLRNQNYAVQVHVRGQFARLDVDEIEVLAGRLPSPLAGEQIGVFAWGSSTVTFDGLKIIDQKGPKAFVMMPFREPFDSLYREVIKPVSHRLGIEAFRADDIASPGLILQDIVRSITSSNIIITEISTENPNVFYELGFAHALDKPTVLLAKRDSRLPFDISGYRTIFYDDSIRGKTDIEKSLEQHLRNILRTPMTSHLATSAREAAA